MTATASVSPRIRRARPTVEIVLLAVVLCLVAFGILLVTDSSFPMSIYNANMAMDHSPYTFGRIQGLGLIAGLVCMALTIFIGYERLKRFASPLLLLGGVLLLLVWAPGVGVAHLHGARWVKLGIRFQPSEVAKLLLVFFLANMMARRDFRIRSFARGVVPALIAAGAYMLLICIEPDLGTTVVVFLTFLTMMITAGARIEHITVIVATAAVLFVAKGGLKPGQHERIDTFISQAEDHTPASFQSLHSKLALGSGEIAGVGWGKGREKYIIPQASSDFIFSTVGEELGLVGCAALVILFGVVTYCGIAIAMKTHDEFGRMLAIGITALITWQAIINIAVVTLSIPATGVPLPFISYGSTALIFCLIGIGLLISIAQSPYGSRGIATRPIV